MDLRESNRIKWIKCLNYAKSHHHSHHHPSCHHNLRQQASTVIRPEEGRSNSTKVLLSFRHLTNYCETRLFCLTVMSRSHMEEPVPVLGRQHSQPRRSPRIENSKQRVWNLVPALLLLNPSWPCIGDCKCPQLAPSPHSCWERQGHVGNDFTCRTTQVPLAIPMPVP